MMKLPLTFGKTVAKVRITDSNAKTQMTAPVKTFSFGPLRHGPSTALQDENDLDAVLGERGAVRFCGSQPLAQKDGWKWLNL
jgi:hypothetical protein